MEITPGRFRKISKTPNGIPTGRVGEAYYRVNADGSIIYYDRNGKPYVASVKRFETAYKNGYDDRF
jgi:hypothetical protein